MIEVENEVRQWREKVERESSLSPREIDELEDHLLARVEIAMELDPALAPARALAIARDELGQATELSQEFAKAGKPRWRRWLCILDGLNPLVELGIGYWTWLGSFGCLAAALWLRDREWASAKAERVIA